MMFPDLSLGWMGENCASIFLGCGLVLNVLI